MKLIEEQITHDTSTFRTTLIVSLISLEMFFFRVSPVINQLVDRRSSFSRKKNRIKIESQMKTTVDQ